MRKEITDKTVCTVFETFFMSLLKKYQNALEKNKEFSDFLASEEENGTPRKGVVGNVNWKDTNHGVGLFYGGNQANKRKNVCAEITYSAFVFDDSYEGEKRGSKQDNGFFWVSVQFHAPSEDIQNLMIEVFKKEARKSGVVLTREICQIDGYAHYNIEKNCAFARNITQKYDIMLTEEKIEKDETMTEDFLEEANASSPEFKKTVTTFEKLLKNVKNTLQKDTKFTAMLDELASKTNDEDVKFMFGFKKALTDSVPDENKKCLYSHTLKIFDNSDWLGFFAVSYDAVVNLEDNVEVNLGVFPMGLVEGKPDRKLALQILTVMNAVTKKEASALGIKLTIDKTLHKHISPSVTFYHYEVKGKKELKEGEEFDPSHFRSNVVYDTPSYVYEVFQQVEKYLKLIGQTVKRDKALLKDFTPEEINKLGTVEFCEPHRGASPKSHLKPVDTFKVRDDVVSSYGAVANVGYALVRSKRELQSTLPCVMCNIEWLPEMEDNNGFVIEVGITDESFDNTDRFFQAKKAFERAILSAAKTVGFYRIRQVNDRPFINHRRVIQDTKTLKWVIEFDVDVY